MEKAEPAPNAGLSEDICDRFLLCRVPSMTLRDRLSDIAANFLQVTLTFFMLIR